MSGIVYLIQDPALPYIYIGSTTNKLKRRFSNHRCSTRNYSINELRKHSTDASKWVCSVIEEFEDISRENLRKSEDSYIRIYRQDPRYIVVNKRGAYLSEEDRSKQMLKANTKKVMCSCCNLIMSKGNWFNHRNTTKHKQNNVNNVPNKDLKIHVE